MSVWSTRSLLVTALLISVTGWISPASAADDDSRPDLSDAPGIVLPSSARPGDTIDVGSRGWPAGAQVQAVVCGDLAIGGSNTCYLPGAALGRADARGRVQLQLTVAAPPRPCPCVVRLTTFTGEARAENLPLDVIGHRMGTPPTRGEPTADLQLDGVTMRGSGSALRRLLGLSGTAEVVVTVTNRGDAPATVPALRVAVGDGELGEPQRTGVEVPAQQSREVVLEVDLPMGATGSQQATVAWARNADARVDARWSTYPWLLVGIVAALVVIALIWLWWWRWGRDRAAQRRRRAEQVAAYPLPDVVYVEDLGALLVNPAALRGSRTLSRVRGRISSADLTTLAQGGVVDDAPGRAEPEPEQQPGPEETISLLDAAADRQPASHL